MKKLFTLLILLLAIVTGAKAGDVMTCSYDGAEDSNPAGFFTHDSDGKWNYNSKFALTYNGTSFSLGLKMESTTKIMFTTTEVSKITIVQSTWSEHSIRFDGTELDVSSATVLEGKCRVYEIDEVPIGDHTVTRGSGESGIAFIQVEYLSSGNPSITASGATVKATEAGVSVETSITVTGENLTGSTLTASFSPEVSGLEVNLASSQITNGSIETEAVVVYTATENVPESTTTLTFSDGTTSKSVTVTYSALVEAYEQESISEATTWDITADVTGTVQYDAEDREERLYANVPELSYASTFNAKALTFEGEFPCRDSKYAQNGTLRFKTTVDGIVEVTFSNTGGNNSDRYVEVNGVRGSVEAVGTTQKTESFEVQAGNVVITNVAGTEGGTPALRYYKIVFTPSEEPPVGPVDVVMSFPNEFYSITEGDEFTAPELTVTTTDGISVTLDGVVYSSDNEIVATVNEETGEVTIVGVGDTQITATFEGNDQYNAASASYYLTVNEPVLVEELIPVSPTYIYDFSEFDAQTFTKSDNEYVVNNLGILANSKDITIDTSNKTFDGVSYSQCLKFGGGGSATKQNVHFIVDGACQVTVIAVSGKSSETRPLGISINGEETTGDTGSSLVAIKALYTGEDVADVYVYSKNSGINIYAIKVEPVPEPEIVDITLNKYGLSTFFYAEKAFTLPEGLLAATYKVVSVGDGKIKLEPSVIYESGSLLPSCEPVVLKGTANTDYSLTESFEDGEVDNANVLYGSEEGGTVEDLSANYVYYMLSAKNGVVGFYWGAPNGAAFEIGAHKAFVKFDQDLAANIVGFDLGNLTSIESVTAVESANTGAAIYNLNGQKVNGAYKGVVIVNGKKEIRK